VSDALPDLHDPRTLREGVRLFNVGEFYACHDFFEELWLPASEPEKSFLQGLILSTVGFYHLTRGNFNGAVRQWERAFQRLERPEYSPTYLGIETAEFVAALRACEEHLRFIGPKGVRSFDMRRVPLLGLRTPG